MNILIYKPNKSSNSIFNKDFEMADIVISIEKNGSFNLIKNRFGGTKLIQTINIMKSQPKNYLVGWTTEKGEIHFDDTDYMTFSEAIEKAKEYLKDGDDEDEVWEVFEVKSVKKYKLVKDTKVVEIPISKS